MSAVSQKTEVQEPPEGVLALVGQDLSCFADKVVVDTGHLGLGVFQEALLVLQGIGSREVEEAVSVVEEGRRRDNPVGAAVHQEPEISVMPIRIEDQGVEEDHVVQGAGESPAHAIIVFPDRLHAASPDNAPHGHEGAVHAGEELASGAEDAFPAGETVWHGVHAEDPRDLAGVEFGIGLVTGIGGAHRAALEEEDPAV